MTSFNPKYGTRFFVLLLERCLQEYGRHEGNINVDIPPAVAAAIQVIIENLPALLALNRPGPE